MTSSAMNEMASGCCVCSDERGWAENPLVYCDGVGCNIGVHKACYGIVTVPSGNWYCRKCESQERSARVRCELCPSKDGALKRTDNNGWAHVICGLYIPEVRFGSVTTMEPILLSQIPAERFNKVCYICEQNSRGRASVGACMQCNKTGCKQQFHVTCAQAMGLLCEEPGNYMDNVKYCGYCQEHYMKIRKNSNVKTIPPYKPAPVNNACSEESPDKKLSNFNQIATDFKQTAKRKTVSNRPATANGPRLASERKESHIHQPPDHLNGAHNVSSTPSPNAQSQFGKERSPATSNGPSISITSTVAQNVGKIDSNSRFTTSNFVESVITPSESVFAEVQKNKKRKMNESNLATMPSVPLPSSIIDNAITQQILAEQQSQTSVVTAEPLMQDIEHTNHKPSVDQDDDDDEDDDAGDLKFIEEPNLSTLKSTSNTSTNETVNTANSVISSVASCTDSLKPNFSTSNLLVSNTTVSASTAIKTPVATVKSQQTTSSTNPVTSSYLSTSSVTTAESKMSKFQNNSNAPHMLGNQLNPTSSMAQKMFDSLNDELEAHSIFTPSDSSTNPNNFVGPPLYNKIISSTRTKESTKRSNSPANGGPLASLSSSAANFPQTLEELLEKQWEQGGTFLMEQAQHFDIASLLTCLHKLREENLELEEHIRKLKARRDHLLGVNARLAMPLAPLTQSVNNTHPSSQTPPQHASTSTSQSVPHISLHHHVSHQNQQTPAHQSQLPPPTHQNVPHSQTLYHQPTTNAPMCGNGASGNGGNISENSQLRTLPLPSNIYMSQASGNLRSPQTPVYQNLHSIENGLLSHHQHSRVMTVMSNAASVRHHNVSNPPAYTSNQHLQQPQSSNPGVVMRTSNISDVGRSDRR